MRHDIIPDVMKVINNAESVGKRSCIISASSLIKEILSVVQNHGYIGDFEFIDDGRSGKFKVTLMGKINQIKAIRPRFSVEKNEFEKWETRYLPAQGFGLLIVTTSKGVMSQKEAMEKNLGGKLLGYVY